MFGGSATKLLENINPNYLIPKYPSTQLFPSSQTGGAEVVNGFDLVSGEGVIIDSDVVDLAGKIIASTVISSNIEIAC